MGPGPAARQNARAEIFSCSSAACKAAAGASIASSVHAHDGGIDHLHRHIMTGGQRAARPGGVNSAGWNHSA